MDRVGANFQGCLQMMMDRLKTTPLPIQLPLGKEDDFQGVIDLVTMKAIIYDPHSLGTKYDVVDIPETYLKQASIARNILSKNWQSETTISWRSLLMATR
jgi:elongation factor G